MSPTLGPSHRAHDRVPAWRNALTRTVGRIAIAHEWVSARAGSEKVFEELARVYPEADLFALTATPGVELQTNGRGISTTFLDRVGPMRDRRGVTLPAMPLAWRLAGRQKTYDTVITSSHACVKGFWPGRSSRHYCYVHAPMRYVWNPEIDDRGGRRALLPARAALRAWDRNSTRWVDSFAANSTSVAERVWQSYGREARVIHPPVDTTFFAGSRVESRDGLVTIGRLIPYKGHDLAIRVAAEMDLPIKVVGKGPEEGNLRRLARELGARVSFIVDGSDEDVRASVASSRALIFAADEDFGIVPVEAQAAGTPVVGPNVGGLRDTVISGQTGVLARSLMVRDLVEATQAVLLGSMSEKMCRSNAERFGVERFRREIVEWVGAA